MRVNLGVKKQKRRGLAITLLSAVAVVFLAMFFAKPEKVVPAVSADTTDQYIHIGDYFSGMPNSFDAKVTTEGTSMDVSGVFIRRSNEQSLSANTIYWCSVYPVIKSGNSLVIVDQELGKDPSVIQNFMHASFTPVKRVDNRWQELQNSSDGDFWLEVSDTKTAVIWYLRQTAPLGNYGVRFKNTKGTAVESDDEEYVYQVVHTGDWTFVSLDSQYGTKVIKNFTGGPFTPLRLYLSYNEGAMVTSKLTEIPLPNGATVGNVLPELIVNTEMWNLNTEDKDAMGKSTYSDGNIDNIQISVMGGEKYQDLYTIIDGNDRNAIDLFFRTPLGKGVYIIKFGSALDQYVYGTLIIDNTNTGGVNLSVMWKFFVFFGAALAVGVSILYFVPVIIRHRNEVKVFRENERIQREKMGVKEAVGGSSKDGKKKGGLKEKLHDFKAKWKGTYNAEQEKKKEEEERLKLEAGISEENEPQKRKNSGHLRFTDTIREKRERRQIAQQQGLTEDDLKRMEESVTRLKQAKEDSFVHLREDTPIAKYKDKKIINSADDITKNATESGGAVFTPIEGAAAAQAASGIPGAAGASDAETPAGDGAPVPQPPVEDNKELVQQGGAVFVPLSDGPPVEYTPPEETETDENPEGAENPDGSEAPENPAAPAGS